MKTPIHLLTREDKLKLLSSFNSSFHRKDELLLPDDEVYPNQVANNYVEKVGKKICVWLGVKPRSLKFTNDENSLNGFTENSGKYMINIRPNENHNTLESAAIIARSCVAYFLVRNGYQADDELIEIGLIELGLGIFVINTLDSGSGLFTSIYRTFPIKHSPKVNSAILSYFSPTEFIRHFSAYVSRNELDHRAIMEHLMPWGQKLVHLSLDASGKLLEPDYVILGRRNRAQNRLKIIGIGALLLTIIVPGVFFWQYRPKTITISAQKHKDDIEVLAAAYQACENSLGYKQKQYDLSDIFMIRQIDAQLSRCQSLRNRHDHLVKIYNQEVSEYY
jgi:hypothetical protein